MVNAMKKSEAEELDTDDMKFNSMADYEDFLIWGTDYKDQFF